MSIYNIEPKLAFDLFLTTYTVQQSTIQQFYCLIDSVLFLDVLRVINIISVD